MIKKELIDQFILELPLFEKSINAFENGEIDRKTLKGITGGFGSYAQKSGGYMLRLRLPAGRISKDTLKFIADKISEHHIDLLKLTTCQTIQLHNLSAGSVTSLIREALDFGIITRGGGGDNPRNTMATPLSGVNPAETFDVIPYALAVGDYMIPLIPSLHMPRKLKVCFSNTLDDEVHATFRDLGFVARKDGTFSVYCAGGLGPNPKPGVHITDGASPKEVSLYISAMIRLFTKYGNYESRAKSRTRYLQDTLGEENLRKYFLEELEHARKEESAVPIPHCDVISKSGNGLLDDSLIKNPRITAQKQEGLFAVSYHPVGGRLAPEKPAAIYDVIKGMDSAELRISPDGTLYIINLDASEVSKVLSVTDDGAESLFETSVSCIGSLICQHGLRNSYGLLNACIDRIRKENFSDGVLPKINISGCPSSCGTHQAGTLGFVGHSKKIDGAMQPAFKLFVNGSSKDYTPCFGKETAVILESMIPDFLADLGKMVSAENSTFEKWYPEHTDAFRILAENYASRTR